LNDAGVKAALDFKRRRFGERSKPEVDMSKADIIFKGMCEDILENGFSSEGMIVRARWEDGTPAHTIKNFGVVNQYDLAQEFPVLTLRPTPLKLCVEEMLWIWQKKSNKTSELSSGIWNSWTDEDGTIGKAYGYQLGVKYKFSQGEMDQVDNVLWQLKNTPYSRRIMTNMYNFGDLSEMGLEPCAYSMTFNVTGDRLNAVLNQRSQDILTANNWNVVQYAVLVHMLARVSGLLPGKLLHVIADAHIYDRHVPLIKEMLERPSFPAPKFKLNPDVKDFYLFTPEDAVFEDYQTNPQIKGIPVAV
jgi:thymidylate synthase